MHTLAAYFPSRQSMARSIARGDKQLIATHLHHLRLVDPLPRPGLALLLKTCIVLLRKTYKRCDSWVKLVPSPQSVCMTASSKLRAAQTPHRCRQPAALPTACAGNGGTQSLWPDQTLARAFRAPCGGLGRPDGRGVRTRGGARGGIRVHAAYPS